MVEVPCGSEGKSTGMGCNLTDSVAGPQVSSPMKVNRQILFEVGKKTLVVDKSVYFLGIPKSNVLLNAYCCWKATSSK